MTESAVEYKTVEALLEECRKRVPTVAWRELPNFIGGAVACTVRSGGCVVNLAVWWDEGRARYGASTFDGTDRSFHSHFGATPDAVAHPALLARVAAAVASRADADARTAAAESDVAASAAALEQARNRVAAAKAGQDMAVRDLADAEQAVVDVFGPMLQKAHAPDAEARDA